MGDKTKFSFPVIVAALSLIVSFLILLFGNNVLDRFTGPKVVMNSIKVNLDYPKDMDQALNEYGDKNNILLFPDCYSIITIKNTGFLPSKNANIQIKGGSNIFYLSSFTTEGVADKKQIDNSTYNIQMPRLSKNAHIEIKVWIKDNNQPLSIIYADDYNSRQLIESDTSSESFLVIRILMVAIILISLGYLIKHIYLKVTKSMEEKRLKLDCDLIMKLVDMFDEKEAEIEKQLEINLQHEQISVDNEETREKLIRLIRKVKEN